MAADPQREVNGANGPESRGAAPSEVMPVRSYDVDLLLVELGADDGGEEKSEEAVCLTVQDVFASRSRFMLADLIAEFLEQEGITPTELLHRVEPQKGFLLWGRREAMLDRLSQTQARPGRRTPAMRLEELKRLEAEIHVMAQERAYRGAPPTFDHRSFGAVGRKTMAAGATFAGRYALDAAVAAWLSDTADLETKLVRLLSLDSDDLPMEVVDVLDQIIGEILASALGIDVLFGWIGGVRGTLEVMALVWKGDVIAHPRAPAVMRRLAKFVGAYAAPRARQGLEASLHRALQGDETFAEGTGRPRSSVEVTDELLAIGALATKLMAHGALIGGERTDRLLDLRAMRLLTEERLEATLKGKSVYARLIDLLTFETAVTGENARRTLLGAIQRAFEARDFTQKLFETARTARARIKALSDLQRRVTRTSLPDALRDRYVRMLDDIQFTYLRTNSVFLRIAKDHSPTVDEVMEFANLLAEGAFTEGKCAGTARELVGHHVRSTAFLRAYFARHKDAGEHRAERFRQFFTTLADGGTPLRDMASIRVLLADDEPAARSYVEMILRDLGIEAITTASDGREALGCFQKMEKQLDLIVCDWKMPRMSGLEFLKNVRAKRPELPFLMVTALATIIAVEEAMAHDVTAYIAKPFAPEQLEEKILVLVNR